MFRNNKINFIIIGYGEDEMTPECKDIIDKLLNLNYKKRLGA